MDVQSTTHIQNLDWTTNARVAIKDLAFGEFEPGGQLFGFDAQAIVDILRNQAGQITLDLILRWDLKDPDMTFKTVLRKSIERSIKATFLNNLDNVLMNTLDRVSEEEGLGEDVKDFLQKIKGAVRK